MDDDDQAGVVLGTSGQMKTMADNTMRIFFDIEPRYAALAFQLFGMTGTPVAIARIMPEVAVQQSRQETIADSRPKGGELCKLAAQFCNSEQFRAWMRLKYDPMPVTADDAATIIKKVCGITSRAYLDHDPVAAARFHEVFRNPYRAYLGSES